MEPIKDVRFTLHDGPQQEQMFWGTVCGTRYRYNPKDKITELQWDKLMEGVKCFGPQNRQG